MAVPGTIGRFRILSVLGRGAMGVVYRGRDEALERDAAIKVMVGEADADNRRRFEREARAAARLQHPNITTVYELGEHAGAPFIAMELLEGVDLQRAITGGLRPNPRANLPIVLQVLAGLGHAHEHGIVHRDVKPSNVFLPGKLPAKLMDFGVARLGGGSTTGMMVGTPNYMSPEQVSALDLDGRSDLFSVGLILYELVTGERAYKSDSMVALLYAIAHEDADLGLLPRRAEWDRLRAVLARALARDRDERYADADSMAADLRLALADLGGPLDTSAHASRAVEGTGPRRATAEGDAADPSRRDPDGVRRGKQVLAAAVVAAALIVAGAAAVARLRAPTVPPSPTLPAASPYAAIGDGAVAPSPPVVTPPPAPPPTAPPPTSPPKTVAHGRTASPAPRIDRAPATDQDQAAERLRRASDLYEGGRFAAAMAEARVVLRAFPGNAEAKSLVDDIAVDVEIEKRLLAARAAVKRGDREAALAEVRAGLAVRDTDARLKQLLRELAP